MESANGLADANWRRQMLSVRLKQTMLTGVVIEILGGHPVKAPVHTRRIGVSGIAIKLVGNQPDRRARHDDADRRHSQPPRRLATENQRTGPPVAGALALTAYNLGGAPECSPPKPKKQTRILGMR